jgi:large subunit ribosomal protein L30
MASPKKTAGAKKTVTVRQTRGFNRRPKEQEVHLRSLGLGKIGRVRTLEDTPAVRGLIEKVKHLVEVVEG